MADYDRSSSMANEAVIIDWEKTGDWDEIGDYETDMRDEETKQDVERVAEALRKQQLLNYAHGTYSANPCH
ncbi:hypothetical protein ACOMHN_026149 [Nucella lapillus]